MATRHQNWSALALSRLTARRSGQAEKFSLAKYKTRCLSTPNLVQRAGLVQAVAFLQSRNDSSSDKYLDDLASAGGLEDGASLLTASQEAGLGEYMALTADVVALATWFRRFAQSELAGVEADDN